ncbi:PIG-L deacetylase family protein [Pollutimonas sp. M17]|uniref:PIG-L deacetylase family protein n=1 Tax=Pollutimonas sp. M17 TaxID=2962065 RepID=UPI0021F482E2|nr:PIG-L deacetylase family protein [Pollutimonas sp. M17]UYO95120.1 PIG-L family deacetylase [Pollutimonas sp. M17]HWK70564.1 PIG-L deacetylase family protein [Burkholderiaceae bacterium]
MTQRNALVISAHSADFVWRAGGAIALYAERGWNVHILCLSFGERGESAKLWKQPGMTLERVKAARKQESEQAAGILGASISFMDCGDYPLRVNDDALLHIAGVYRELRPEFVLTHSFKDPYNFDHPLANHLAMEARIIAQAHGHTPSVPVLGAPPVFLFEPHQPEQCEWKPQLYLDISTVWDKKYQAFQIMDAQEHLWEYYTRAGLQRGAQAARNSGRKIKYAEAYQTVYPRVTDELL